MISIDGIDTDFCRPPMVEGGDVNGIATDFYHRQMVGDDVSQHDGHRFFPPADGRR